MGRRALRRIPALSYALLATGVVVVALAGFGGYVLYPRFNLPSVTGLALLVLAAGAGIASFFSPCSFPLLVTLLSRETRAAQDSTVRVRRALTFAVALALGAAAFLLVSGGAIAAGGAALLEGVTFTSLTGRLVRLVVGGLLIALGLIQYGVLRFPFHAAEAPAHAILELQARLRRERPALGFGVLGFGYLLAGFG